MPPEETISCAVAPLIDHVACPEHSNTAYIHIPFPVDYNWNGINDYTTDRGIAFDIRVTSAILRQIELVANQI